LIAERAAVKKTSSSTLDENRPLKECNSKAIQRLDANFFLLKGDGLVSTTYN